MNQDNPFHPYPMPKLTCELVPSSQWEQNLRSHLTPADWNSLRSACYVRASYRCECCGGVGRKHPVECHETWSYDDELRIQKLEGLIALCPDCHKVKHIGFASTQGKLVFAQALGHLATVNEWPAELVEEYVGRQFEIHRIRSMWDWTLDLSWLDNKESYCADAHAFARGKRSDRVRALLDTHSAKS